MGPFCLFSSSWGHIWEEHGVLGTGALPVSWAGYWSSTGALGSVQAASARNGAYTGLGKKCKICRGSSSGLSPGSAHWRFQNSRKRNSQVLKLSHVQYVFSLSLKRLILE